MTATSTLDTLINQVEDKSVPLARLARVLLAKGEGERARELCARAVAMAPEDAEVRILAAEIFSHDVPLWHFYISRDQARNRAYEAVLRRAIYPGCRVLDIGTGNALFALLAARAGAQVVTCERQTAVAAAASEIIVRNGYADRVRVVPKDSADLEIGVDLDQPADLLVIEPFTASIIAGGILPVIELAKRRLLREGAQIIPSRATVRIALADDRDAHREQLSMVEGFDLSPFNRLLAPTYVIAVGDDRLTLRSKPADLIGFDFQAGGPFPEDRASASLSSTGGRVNGIAQWIHLTLDAESHYENTPAIGSMSAWSVRFFPLMRPIKMAPGDVLTVCGDHDRQSLRVWAGLSMGDDRSTTCVG
jgi:type II protein arginine methyltransferase